MTDNGEKYVHETQKLVEIQHLVITGDLQGLFKDTEWTVEEMSFVVGHKSVSASVEMENLFRSYWDHRLGVSDELLQAQPL